jgi:hypothetical protein
MMNNFFFSLLLTCVAATSVVGAQCVLNQTAIGCGAGATPSVGITTADLFAKCVIFEPCASTLLSTGPDALTGFASVLARHRQRATDPPNFHDDIIKQHACETCNVQDYNERVLLLYISWLEATSRTCPYGTQLVPTGGGKFDCECQPGHKCHYEAPWPYVYVVVGIILLTVWLVQMKETLTRE